MGKRLYVGNLSYSVDNSQLEQLFAGFGQVQSAEVVMDRDTGRSKGFGFVEMSTDEEAQAAIDGLSGKEHGGRALAVVVAAVAVAAVVAAAAVAVSAIASNSPLRTSLPLFQARSEKLFELKNKEDHESGPLFLCALCLNGKISKWFRKEYFPPALAAMLLAM